MGLTVDGDTNDVAELLELATSQAERAEIPKDKVVLSARGLQLVVESNELLTKGLSVLNDLESVRLPCWLGRLEEGGGNTSNGLYEGMLTRYR